MRKLTLTLALAASALLVACGDSRGPSPLEAVPANASTLPAATISYLQALTDTAPAESDAAEPVAVPDQLAVDDTGEPKAVN